MLGHQFSFLGVLGADGCKRWCCVDDKEIKMTITAKDIIQSLAAEFYTSEYVIRVALNRAVQDVEEFLEKRD